MIVIPMLGKSSRFFSAGYDEPKYQLPLWGGTVFSESLSSFKEQFSSTPFLFLLRADFSAREFVARELVSMGIKDYRIIEFMYETDGQAHSVFEGTRDYRNETPIIVFNIDTIRHRFSIPSNENFGDGFLEVFKGDGDAWSFVQLGENSEVIRTAEKRRISELCSNGMYGFKRLGDFREAYILGSESCLLENREVYIAPLYNVLIQKGFDIRCIELPIEVMSFCGTPDEYQSLIKSI